MIKFPDRVVFWALLSGPEIVAEGGVVNIETFAMSKRLKTTWDSLKILWVWYLLKQALRMKGS